MGCTSVVECLPIVCKAQGFLLKIIKVSLRGRGKDEVEGYRKPDFFGGLEVSNSHESQWVDFQRPQRCDESTFYNLLMGCIRPFGVWVERVN